MIDRISRFLAVPILSFVCALPGCGKSPSESTTKSKTPSIEKSPPEKLASRQKSKPVKNPRRADAAVEAVFSGIRNRQPEALWAFLPASYQSDVNGLFHLLAMKMDAELWNRTFSVGKRIVKLCRARKATILDSGLIQPTAGSDEKTLSAEWNAVVTLAGTLLESDLADLRKMKEFDGGEFLASTGGRFMDQLALFSRLLPGNTFQVELNDLANLRAKVVSETDNSAIVELSFRDDEADPQRVPFVRIEGKWIPKKLAAGWQADMAALRSRIAQQLAPKVLAEKKKQFLKLLTVVEKSLDALEAAKSPAEFQKRFAKSAVAAIVLGYFRAATRRGQPPGVSVLPKGVGKKSKPGKARMITVVVRKRLESAVAEGIAEKLLALTADADVGQAAISAEESSFPVTTAVDFASFQKAIKFATVVSADAKQRRIVIRLK